VLIREERSNWRGMYRVKNEDERAKESQAVIQLAEG
jgi:hypothetical protein